MMRLGRNNDLSKFSKEELRAAAKLLLCLAEQGFPEGYGAGAVLERTGMPGDLAVHVTNGHEFENIVLCGPGAVIPPGLIIEHDGKHSVLMSNGKAAPFDLEGLRSTMACPRADT